MAINVYAGKNLKDYTYEDLMKLKRKQLLDLFNQLDAPSMSEMNGEYRAFLLDSGYIINSALARLYLHFTWGNWQHKAFSL